VITLYPTALRGYVTAWDLTLDETRLLPSDLRIAVSRETGWLVWPSGRAVRVSS
jgi:hypothetical protein